MSKAQGISINTIIIAAIALIVLVVLIAFFTGQITNTSKQLYDQSTIKCENMGGEPKPAAECPTLDIIYGKFEGFETGQVCCKKKTTTTTTTTGGK